MEEEFGQVEVEYCDDDEIDSEYEFDAPQFFDFTHHDTLLDDAEAEEWFEFAPSYPPSPFLSKMRWGNYKGVNMVAQNSGSMETEGVSNSSGVEHNKTKHIRNSSSSKAKDFSFMKPTASHLAKQKITSENQNPQSSRSQRKNSSSPDVHLTKRQKLDAGYLSKIARLKHHILFTHKKTEGDCTDINLAFKSNVTVAKEPNLVTAQRAKRHKSKTNAESDGFTQSSFQVLNASTLNKKISEVPVQIFSKMKTPPRPTEFQVFHLRTSERAKRNSNAGSTISNSETQDLQRTRSSVDSRQEKCRKNNKLSSKSERGIFRNIKVHPLEQNHKESLNEPPTESFSKLTLASSEVKQTTKSQSKEQPNSKGLKENRCLDLCIMRA